MYMCILNAVVLLVSQRVVGMLDDRGYGTVRLYPDFSITGVVNMLPLGNSRWTSENIAARSQYMTDGD